MFSNENHSLLDLAWEVMRLNWAPLDMYQKTLQIKKYNWEELHFFNLFFYILFYF